MFYQGIDKVSQISQTSSVSGEEPPDDLHGEAKPECASAESGGKNAIDVVGDTIAKYDEDLDDAGTVPDPGEMTDAELASRHESSFIFRCQLNLSS